MKKCTLCHITTVKDNKSWCNPCTKEYSKQYRKTHKSHLKKLNKKWRIDNKEYLNQNRFEYYSTPKGRMIELNRTAKRRAKKRKIDFNINTEFLLSMWKKQNGKCAITNLDMKISNKRNGGKALPFSPSLDRINPKQGYIKGNVRLVCYVVNLCLHDYGTEIFSIIANAYLYGVIPKTLPTLLCKEKKLSHKQKKDKRYREKPNGIITGLLGVSKRSSKINKYDFNLTKDFIKDMFLKQNNKCKLTNITFENKTYNVISNPFRPSIDRIDPTKGYTKDNVRLVCVAVNYALNEFGEKIFRKICQAYLKLTK